MERHEETEEIPEPSPGAMRSRPRRRPDPFLVVCRCFSFVTALIAILCVVVNVLAAIISFRDSHDIFDGIFRCYAILIACFVVLAETEWGFIIKFSKVLEYWACRGMLQIFAAVMTRAFPDYMTQRKDLLLLLNIASYMLLACGVIYFLCFVVDVVVAKCVSLGIVHLIVFFSSYGLLCIGCLKRARQQKEVSREQAIKDLEEMGRRREELEQVLLEHQSRDQV